MKILKLALSRLRQAIFGDGSLAGFMAGLSLGKAELAPAYVPVQTFRARRRGH